MGHLIYGSSAEAITLSDELLAYVRLIAGAKLRNNESFMLSWHHEGADEGDRSSAWLNPAIAIRFVFDHPAKVEIDPVRLAHLHAAANSASGLVLPAPSDGEPDARPDPAPVATLQRGARRPRGARPASHLSNRSV